MFTYRGRAHYEQDGAVVAIDGEPASCVGEPAPVLLPNFERGQRRRLAGFNPGGTDWRHC